MVDIEFFKFLWEKFRSFIVEFVGILEVLGMLCLIFVLVEVKDYEDGIVLVEGDENSV